MNDNGIHKIKNCYSCKWHTWLDGTYFIGYCCGKVGITRDRNYLGKLDERPKEIQRPSIKDGLILPFCESWEKNER